jgi:hypothetical protein
MAEAIGDERLVARRLSARSLRALDDGRLDDAVADIRRACEIDRDLGFSVFIAADFVRLATILARRQSLEQAVRLVARADLIHAEIGMGRESWAQEERDDVTATLHAGLGAEMFARAWSEGELLSVDSALELALGET